MSLKHSRSKRRFSGISRFWSRVHKGSVLDSEASSRTQDLHDQDPLWLPLKLPKYQRAFSSPVHLQTKMWRGHCYLHPIAKTSYSTNRSWIVASPCRQKREHLQVLPPGAVCLINVLRSAVGEDCAVSVRSRITLFLQTDTLFPAIRLAGAGSSRRAVQPSGTNGRVKWQ